MIFPVRASQVSGTTVMNHQTWPSYTFCHIWEIVCRLLAYSSGLFSRYPQGEKMIQKSLYALLEQPTPRTIQSVGGMARSLCPSSEFQRMISAPEPCAMSWGLSCIYATFFFGSTVLWIQGFTLKQALLPLELLCQPFFLWFFFSEMGSCHTICPGLGLTSNPWSSWSLPPK
jgi:hypothetical protein